MSFLVCLFFDSSLPFKECFFFRKKKSLWVWKNVLSLSEPKPDARAAFRVVIDNNWQGIAYLMLEVSGLDFLEAIQVAEIVASLKLVTNTYMTNNLAGKQIAEVRDAAVPLHSLRLSKAHRIFPDVHWVCCLSYPAGCNVSEHTWTSVVPWGSCTWTKNEKQ